MTAWYRTGTASVSNGSAAVTGTTTAWANQVLAGDAISFDAGGKWYEIASVTDNTHLTLATNFAETTVSGGSYAIQRTSPQWSLASDLATRIGALLASQTDIYTGSGAPSSSLGADGSVYYDTAGGFLYGPKASGAWGTGVRYLLPVGLRFTWSTNTASSDPGSGTLKCNNASPASATALYISETDADGNSVAAELAKWFASTSSVKATIVIRKSTTSSLLRFDVTAGADNGSWDTLTVTAGALTGSLSNGDIVYVSAAIKGDKGDTGSTGSTGSTGATGPGYAATSSTSLATANSGSKTFTTQSGLAYSVGARIRASSAGTSDWMEGLVTSYSGTSLVVTMDKANGSGTHTDWNINLAGQPGSGDLSSANNLSDVASVATARANLKVRELLSADRTYYVRSDGSDSNTGLANNSGGAFLTLQKAADTAGSVDAGTYNITIQVADATYAASVTLPVIAGSGSCTLKGNTGTPANCIISTSGDCIKLAEKASWNVKGFKLTSSGGSGIVGGAYSKCVFDSMNFASCSTAHIQCNAYCSFYASGNYTISGGAIWHILASAKNYVEIYSKTITLSGTPAFSGPYVQSSGGSTVTHGSCTFSGSATGQRYSVSDLSVIDTNGGGSNYFPGNSAGSGTNPSASPYGYYK